MTRILTIEDDAVTAREIVAELSSHGLDVDWVDNGREGLARAVSGNYDLITLDRMLPELDGLAIVTTLRVADLELNLISHEASRDGQLLTLLPTEYKLLEFLMRNTGQILSRMMIFEEVWGYHFDPGTNLIDVHIGRLRKKIDPPGNVPLIRTVRGSGYVIAEPL